MATKNKIIHIRPYTYQPKPRRDYIVEGDPEYPEEIHTNKRVAIKAAKEMARKSSEDAMVIPCVDFEPNDFAPYYVITPQGEVIERK